MHHLDPRRILGLSASTGRDDRRDDRKEQEKKEADTAVSRLTYSKPKNRRVRTPCRIESLDITTRARRRPLGPIFVDFLQNPKRLRTYAGVADLPGVHLVVDEGCSSLRRTQQRFDVIQMSMLDTFAATGAGAFSLSENGLYTVEGWRIFLSALTPGGVLTVSRWYAREAPVEIGRVVSLASRRCCR